MNCPSCDGHIEADSLFCRHCGAQAQAPAVEPTEPAEAGTASDDHPKSNTDNSVVAALLIGSVALVVLFVVAILPGLSGAEGGNVEAAKDAVRRTMLDPDAAQFRDVERCSGDRKVVRGEVNGKNSFGAYTGFKSFFYADYHVANLEDPDFTEIMNRCYNDLPKDSAQGGAGNVQMPTEEALPSNALSANPTPKSEPMDDISEAEEATAAAVEEAGQKAARERCWQDYCPCDTSDPDYGGADVTICRNLRGGVEVDDQIMSSGAAMRDSRRSLREFDAKN